jgi:hypothetical protein
MTGHLINWTSVGICLGVTGFNFLLLFFMRDAKGTSSIYFKLTLIATLGWTLSVIATELEPNAARIVIWSRLSVFFPVAIFLFLQPFAILAQKRTNESWFKILPTGWRITTALLWMVGICLGLVSVFTPLVLRDVHNLVSEFGPLQSVYGLYAALAFLVIIALLIRSWRQASARIIKNQLRLIIVGCVISITFGFVTNFVIPLLNLGEFRFLGPLGLSVFLACSTYAIVAYHLFDIRSVISRAIIYSLLVSFSMAIYGLTVYFITSFVGSAHSSILIVSFITAGALAYSFDPLRQRIAEMTDSWLFKKEYEQQEVTKTLSERLANVIGLDEGLDAVMHTLTETLHLNHAVTYVFQTGDLGKQIVKRSRHIGYSDIRNLELTERDFMIQYFTTHPSTILLQSMEDQYEREEKAISGDNNTQTYMTAKDLRSHAIRKVIIDKLHDLDVAVAIPLHLGDEQRLKPSTS